MRDTDEQPDERNVDETSINRQVKDILRITGQNEVIQSFVRSDLSNDSEETQTKDGGSGKSALTSKEKQKATGGGRTAAISRKKSQDANGGGNVAAAQQQSSYGATEKSARDQKEDGGHGKGVQFYQSLGKDAQSMRDFVKRKGTDGGWNRRQRLFEEVYTDKDRAAAVNLGSRDIKQSLKLKRRQDRTRILEISEETHPGTLLALAVHRYKNGDVYVAMKFVTKALELNPVDRNALVARSKCHLFMGNAHLALRDAEQALVEDKNFIKGIYQKAEALYHLAQFEYSLLYFHRGLHIRYQMEDFKQGVLKAQQAILNTIGKTVPSFEKFWLQRKKGSRQSEYIDNKNLFEQQSKQIQISTDLKSLKALQNDKQYLEYLLRHPDVLRANGNPKTENKIIIEAEEGMQFLEKRQHFWRQQQALTPAKAARSSKRKTGSKCKKY